MVSAILKRSFKYIQWLLYPPFCVQCKIFLDEAVILCSACYEDIKPIASVVLPITQQRSIRVFAISAYEEPIKSLILGKVNAQRLASRQLGELMWRTLPLSTLEFDYVVPIPLHWTRYAYRSFNQAEEMAYVIARKSGKPLLNLLYRNRRTPFQSSLPSDERANNVAQVFSLKENKRSCIAGKKILLVDDLMTTGSTLKAAVSCIARYRPLSIDAVVASRCN